MKALLWVVLTALALPALPLSAQTTPDTASTRRISCGTLSSRQQVCGTGRIVDTARMVDQVVFSRCRQGSNWGYKDSLLWAGHGCRAEFEVTYRAAAKRRTRNIACGRQTGELYPCEAAGYVDTVRLIREVSSNTCRQKFNWDYARTFVWARSGCRGIFEITYGDSAAGAPTTGTRTASIGCGSDSSIRSTCLLAGSATRVRLVRDLSGTRCREGSSWGYTEAFLWTNGGCRGEFEVTYGGVAAGKPDTATQMKPTGTATKVVSCGNASGSAMSCNAFGTVATVRLSRDRSGGRCAQSGTWGLAGESIWVARGCYGDFELTYVATK